MSNDDRDEGGIVLGGISFGVGKAGGDAPKGTEPSTAQPTSGSEPVQEMGDHLLPLRAVVIADLIPREEHNAGANPPEQPTRVEVGYLDALLARLAPRLAIEVESVLKDGAKVRIDFAPTAMKSFRPDNLVREIPLLRSLLDGKNVLERLRDGTLDVAGAQRELGRLWEGSSLVARVLGGVEVRQPAAAPTPSSNSDGTSSDVDRILDMVGGGDGQASAAPAPKPAGKGRFDAFIAAVAKSGGDKPGARPDRAIATVEKALGLQLGAILQHPELQRLERAWRGLELLASRTPKEGVRLEVISARPDDAPAALERAIRTGAGIEPPVSFAVVDVSATGDAPSFARLRALGEVAEAHSVPVIANVEPSFLGASLHDIDRLDNKQALYEAPERAPWRAEAERSSAMWLALCLNRVLGRLAYDRRSSRIREATVEEQPAGDHATIWLSPCWAVGSLVLESFGKKGWPCRITGRDGGMVENLPVHEVATGYEGSERIAIPTEAFFSTETQKALGRIGILALASQPNSDAAYLLSATTAYVPRPKRAMDEEGPDAPPRYPRTSLGDQLFVARLVQFLRALGSRIGPGEAPDAIKQVLEAALWELFRDAPAGMEIDVAVTRSEQGLDAAVTVRPRRFLGVSMEEITLGIPIG